MDMGMYTDTDIGTVIDMETQKTWTCTWTLTLNVDMDIDKYHKNADTIVL
jgi:hypothetical protein